MTQFYVRTDAKDKSGKYLKKSEKVKIKNYLQKSYDEKVIKILDKESAAIEKFLKCGEKFPDKILEIYAKFPQNIRDNIIPFDISDKDYAGKWQEIPFECKGMPETKEIFQTNRGEYVRSKSELTIANALDGKGIPYKYECPLKLRGGIIIYPDFTALNVKERRVYYWEHRGMMDTQDYARNSVLRIKDYMRNHIFPGKNLILTEETSDNPLGTAEINAVISEYLL